MKFEKIIIPPGWQESFTKYPNGRTIFEALSHTITSVNEGIDEVNHKVNQGLLSIDQAETLIRNEITESFNTLKLQLEGEIDELSSDLIADFALLQSEVLTLIAGKADKTYVDAQLAEKVQNFKLKNEVVNGDFSNGIGGWTVSVSSGNISDENQKLKFTCNGSFNFGQTEYFIPNLIAIENHRYYFRTKVKEMSGLASSIALRFSVLGGGSISTINTINNPLSNVDYNLSGIVVVKNQTGQSRMLIRSNYETQAVASNKIFLIDNCLVVNLTPIFGLGNEPTKEEMDELMKVIPNQWWDGELSLTQKQFITWQLNLIRKNTNAIIALGGTII